MKDDTEAGESAREDGTDTTFDIAALPPLPTPNLRIRRIESAVGSFTVSLTILLFVGLTHGVALTMVDGIKVRSVVWWIFLVAIYGEALAAFLLLVAVETCDPGVVPRSPRTCLPIPAEVRPWLRSYADDQDETTGRPSEHYLAASDNEKDTYCVRCLVWRRQPVDAAAKPYRYYHCVTCARCVRHYDHHCGFFGRCIAGEITGQGNYRFFVATIGTGVMAYLTTAAALVWSLSLRYGVTWVMPGAVLYFVGFQGCLLRQFCARPSGLVGLVSRSRLSCCGR